jgi:hypothetical protein
MLWFATGFTEPIEPLRSIVVYLGSPNCVHQIRCGNAYIPVTITLQAALLARRDAIKTRTLWIDQLCINQEDIAERNSQVKIMHMIYKRATRTIIYLETTEAPEPAIKLNTIKLIREARRAHEDGEGPMLKEFQQALSHPWFRRVWILQEVSMSKEEKIIAHCRGSIKSWDALRQGANLLSAYVPGQKYRFLQLPPSIHLHKTVVSTITTLSDDRVSPFVSLDYFTRQWVDEFYIWPLTKFLHYAEPRLVESLQASRFCLATDPRDKVYSLLNMLRINPEYSWLLDVDYALQPSEVFLRAARYSIETEKSLEIMCYKEGGASIPDLPSWAPDWTQQQLFPINRIAMPYHLRSQFHLNIPMAWWYLPLRRSCNKTQVATFSGDGRVITLKGYKLDTISNTSSVWLAGLDEIDGTKFHEWADMYTGGKGSQFSDLPFKPERWPKGIQTVPKSICDFWLRVSRHKRLKTTDTIDPFTSDHPTQKEWRRSPYCRHWHGRSYVVNRQNYLYYVSFQCWLTLMLPFASIGRRVATTRDGYFMLVPPESRADDLVYFLEGGGTLAYIVRKVGSAAKFEYVGTAYVHGFFGTKMKWRGRVTEDLVII